MLDQSSLVVVLPEILLLVMACIVAMVDLGVKTRLRNMTYWLTMATFAAVAWLTGWLAAGSETYYAFGHMLVSDPMGNWLRCFSSLAMMVCMVYGRPYAGDRDMLRGGELFTLAMFALLGMFVMISGNNFLVIYLGLELLTLCSYALVALRRDHAASTEAAMKYFVLGAMASGFLLYGLSMLYGATGSLDIGNVFRAVSSGQVKHQVLVFGLVFIVSGLAFKLGAVPFHMWIPDVYQGAPTAVTLLIAGAPKLAAFAITIRLLVEGMLGMAVDWQQMLIVLSVGSMALGNLAAIAQTNLKRMLGSSTIGQIGFMLLGLCSGVVGFYAKLAVLQALVSTNVTGYIVLAVVAVLLSLIGAFYYLRVVKTMYFEEPASDAPPLPVGPGEARALLAVNGAAVLLFGLLPGGLMAVCADAIRLALAS